MEYRQLGRAGVRVSVLGLGMNRFGSDRLPQGEVNKILDAALDIGINFIDASDTYVRGRCEEILGQALKGRWDHFVVATKGGLPMGEGPNNRGASRYHRYMTAAYYDMLEALMAWAAAHGRGMNELAQAWLMAQPPVCSVITGATSLEQMLQNVTAASWTLTRAELDEVNAILAQGGTGAAR